MNPWFILGVLLAVLGAGASGYLKGRHDVTVETAAAQKHDKDLIDAAVSKIDTSVAQRIASIEVKHVTVRQELQKEIVDRPVYRDCVNTPAGLSLINSALTGEPQPLAPGGGQLPGTGPSH